MSSVQLKSSSEEKMSMYENMVEDLVNSDESSRYMLDGKLRYQIREFPLQYIFPDSRWANLLLMMMKHKPLLSSQTKSNGHMLMSPKQVQSSNLFSVVFSFELEKFCSRTLESSAWLCSALIRCAQSKRLTIIKRVTLITSGWQTNK